MRNTRQTAAFHIPPNDEDETVRCGLCGVELEEEPFIQHMVEEHASGRDEAWQVFHVLASKSLRKAAAELRLKSSRRKPPVSAFVLLDTVDRQLKPVAVTVIKVEADKWKAYNTTQNEVQEFEINRLPL